MISSNAWKFRALSTALSECYFREFCTSAAPRPKTIRLDYDDVRLSKVMLNVKSKKMREKSGLIFLEGKTLLQDMINAGHQPKMVFFSQHNLDDISGLDPEVKRYKAPYKELQLWSDLTTSPGLIAICAKPEPIPSKNDCLPVTILCDQIREPNNLGALLRNAAGAGVRNVILTKGCVDLWDPKVIRSGCGAHFRVPVYDDHYIEELKDNLDPATKVIIATSNPSQSILPLNLYHSVNYSEIDNILLIIGGETEGISHYSYKLAKLFNGIEVNIPLDNNVESLNTVCATAIILFEIKKQIRNLSIS